MEFETNRQPSADEQARLNASAKRITLSPVSTKVVPEPATGADLNTKLSETANQPNVSNDSEDTQSQCDQYSQAAQGPVLDPPSPKKRIVISSTIFICLFAAAFLWMLTQ